MIVAPTGYQVLARKYRPQSLDELIGQETLVRILTNAIEMRRLPHAFILTGVRGVGKTTSARIIARMLNCVGVDGQGQETVNPCGQCDQCRSILTDNSLDVIEMDAASRTGVDDIREIIDAVRYKPLSARYKVYIIDEVHMLTKSAFNALLKTLEEPPSHIKFIFATTEIRKIPDTILSRCVRFELKRFQDKDLIKLLHRVLDEEKFTADEESLKLLARAAAGSARDCLSLLDQAISLNHGKLSAGDVRQMLNLSDRTETLQWLEILLRGDTRQAISVLNAAYVQGKDALILLNDLLDICHLLTLIKTDMALVDKDFYTQQELDIALTLAQGVTIPVLTRFWQLLLKGIQETKLMTSPLQGAQMIFIRLCYCAQLPTPQEVIESLITDNFEPHEIKPLRQPLLASSPPPISTLHKPAFVYSQDDVKSSVDPVMVDDNHIDKATDDNFTAELPTHNKSLLPALEEIHPTTVKPLTSLAEPHLLAIDEQPVSKDNEALNEQLTKSVKNKVKRFPNIKMKKTASKNNVNDVEDITTQTTEATQNHGETISLPSTYQDMVDLFGKKREMILMSTFVHDVHLINYQPGHVILRLGPMASKNFITDVNKSLWEWTNTRWTFEQRQTGGDESLHQQRQQQQSENIEAAKQNPLVKAALDIFPGTIIEKIENQN